MKQIEETIAILIRKYMRLSTSGLPRNEACIYDDCVEDLQAALAASPQPAMALQPSEEELAGEKFWRGAAWALMGLCRKFGICNVQFTGKFRGI